MSMHFRPKIQNGQIIKRTRITSPSITNQKPDITAWIATIKPAWSGKSVGELAYTGLSVFGLEEKLRAIEVRKEKNAEVSRVRVLFGLLALGVILAGGFMFSLRDHFIAHAFGREEVKLKSQLDQTRAEKRVLETSLRQVSNPQAIDNSARQLTSLQSVQLDQKKTATHINPASRDGKEKKQAGSAKKQILKR